MSSLNYASSKKVSKKHYFFTFSLRKNALSIIFVLFTLCLVLFSRTNLTAAKNGLKLWANNVVPSLFPFFIATNLLGHTNVIKYISKFCNKFMRPIFNVPGESAYAFILGLISGYPVGAKIVTDLRNQNLCTKDEGERMLCFTNNSGPLFIIGTVGITLFGSSSIGILLLVTHVLAAITVAILLGIFSRIRKTKNVSEKFMKKNLSQNSKQDLCTFSNLGEVLSTAILDSSKTIIMIGGFVVIFSVIISILENSKLLNLLSIIIMPICKAFNISSSFASPIISGLIELTNGVSIIASIPNKAISVNIILSAFLLGFGGISVLLQVLSITSKSDLSIKKYIIGKLLQGIIAMTYTYILLSVFPILNLNL